jgi:hypothetical protein
MRKIYSKYLLLFVVGSFLTMLITSCKKDHTTPTPVAAPIATLGLYEVNSSYYKRAFIAISQVGTQSVSYYGVFDTGSAGMTIDATGILPASMITSTGIIIPVNQDSVVVDGITVTNKTATVSYGDSQSEVQEYGNLAYAVVKIGDQNGSITTSRIPIFLYYKIFDVNTKTNEPPHSNDVFGVGPGVSFANSAIGSPLSYFKPTNGGISGFKLAMLNNADFSISGTYVSGLLTIGLVPDDVSPSSPFIMHRLTNYPQGGYSPDIAATITYQGQSVPAMVLFDTGTPAITLIENSSAKADTTSLPSGTPVTLTTSSGFSYSYTTAQANDLTTIAQPSFTGDPRTIFSINFFTDNEFLMDYAGHEIGLKNN